MERDAARRDLFEVTSMSSRTNVRLGEKRRDVLRNLRREEDREVREALHLDVSAPT